MQSSYWTIDQDYHLSNTHIQYESDSGDETVTPLIQSMPVAKYLLYGLGNLGVIVDAQGQPAGGAIAWSNTPLCLTYNCPYLISLIQGGTIEIHSDNNSQNQFLVIQSINIPGAQLLASVPLWVSQRNQNRNISTNSDINSYNFLLKAPDHGLICLSVVEIDEQIQELLQLGMIKRALALLEQSLLVEPDVSVKQLRLHQFHLDAAKMLFSNGDIAIGFGELSKAKVDPREIFAYFPTILSNEFEYIPVLLLPNGDDGTDSTIRTIKQIVQPNVNIPEKRILFGLLLQFGKTARDAINTIPIDQTNEHIPKGFLTRSTIVQQFLDDALINLSIQLLQNKVNDDIYYLAMDMINEIAVDETSNCTLGVCAPLLESSKLYHSLGMLYQSHGEGEKALQIWKDLGLGKIEQRGYDGIEETIDYLQKHTNHEDYWSFSTWIFQKQPQGALQIFLHSKVNVNKRNVLQFLQGIPNYKTSLLCITYLEHLAVTENKMDSSDENKWINTELALAYVDSIHAFLAGGISDANHLKAKFKQFLSSNNDIEGTTILSSVSKYGLMDEKILVYAFLNQHETAIEILLTSKQYGIKFAEAYCIEQYKPNVQANPFHSLLGMICDNKLDYQDHVLQNTLYSFLSRFANFMDVSVVLTLVPANLSLANLYSYFQAAIPTTLHKRNKLQIVKGLARTENLTTKFKLLKYQSKGVLITDDMCCSICNKPLDSKVLAMTGFENIAHYHCLTET